jgi:hypothetical protein
MSSVRGSSLRIAAVLFALAAAGWAASLALAEFKEPTGLDKLRFGMSPEDVRKQYPGVDVQTLDRENLGAAPINGPNVVRLEVPNQQIKGLKSPVPLELRFWKNRLWVIIVYFRENGAEDVLANLKTTYGDPHLTTRDPYWSGEKVSLMTAMQERWYALTDNALSKEVQEDFIAGLRGRQGNAPTPSLPPGGAEGVR